MTTKILFYHCYNFHYHYYSQLRFSDWSYFLEFLTWEQVKQVVKGLKEGFLFGITLTKLSSDKCNTQQGCLLDHLSPDTSTRSSHPEVFLGKGVLKICSKFTGEHQLYWNRTSAWVFSCKFAAYFKKSFYMNTSGWLLLQLELQGCWWTTKRK